MTNPAETQKLGEIGNRRDHDARDRVPGASDTVTNAGLTALSPDLFRLSLNKNKINEIQIHAKTVRTLCAKFEGLHANIIEVISIIELYLELHNKHHERAKEIVNWSGSRTNWQRKQHQAIRDGIQAGYIEEFKQMLLISPKGQRVIDLYSGVFEECKNEYIRKAEARKTKPKNKRNNIRRQGEPAFI